MVVNVSSFLSSAMVLLVLAVGQRGATPELKRGNHGTMGRKQGWKLRIGGSARCATRPFTHNIHTPGVRRDMWVRLKGSKEEKIERERRERNESERFPAPNGTRWAGHLKSGFAIAYPHQAKAPEGSGTPLPSPSGDRKCNAHPRPEAPPPRAAEAGSAAPMRPRRPKPRNRAGKSVGAA